MSPITICQGPRGRRVGVFAAVAALSVHLAMTGVATPALLVLGLGLAVLVRGDKIVQPAVAGGATHLRFVWGLIGCLGGFEMLGLVGLMLGPVVLTLARELWEHRSSTLATADRVHVP